MTDAARPALTLADLTWSAMADAVGSAAFRPDELDVGGDVGGFDTSIAVRPILAPRRRK